MDSEFERQHASDLFDATTKWEHASLRPLYLLNGGALVAALAFAGNRSDATDLLLAPMMFWVGGLLLAAVTTATAFYSQFSFYNAQNFKLRDEFAEHHNWAEKGIIVRRIGMVFWSLSVLAFIVGMALGISSLASLSK